MKKNKYQVMPRLFLVLRRQKATGIKKSPIIYKVFSFPDQQKFITLVPSLSKTV